MNLQFFIQLPNQKVYELSQTISSLSWATTLDSQPSKVRFSMPILKEFNIPMGTAVSIKIDNQNLFWGYIFEVDLEKDKASYLAYDQLRYLKNKDTYIFSGKTATQIFEAICADYKLKYKVVDNCDWEVSSRCHDGKTLYEIIDYGYKEALVNNQDWFIIRDNCGVIEQINLKSLKTNLLFSDTQNISKYRYRKSIDKDSYNRIKLVQDNTQEAVRKVYVEQDNINQSTWGILQYYEKVDKNATEQQIKERAAALLKIKNMETKQLSLTCVGAPNNLMAGNWIFIELNPLVDAGFQNYQDYIITHCEHKWENNFHQVKIQVSKFSLNIGG